MLTDDMKTLITHHRAGMVATINDDGTPWQNMKNPIYRAWSQY